MSFSSDVNAGDNYLPEVHNNLRKDVLDVAGGHINDGISG
jgi:hypothetical protein